MDNAGLVFITEHERMHAYAYEKKEEYILKGAYVTSKVESYFWRIRDILFRLFREEETTPVVELLHSSLAHPALWNVLVIAANTWQPNLLLICSSKHCGM